MLPGIRKGKIGRGREFRDSNDLPNGNSTFTPVDLSSAKDSSDGHPERGHSSTNMEKTKPRIAKLFRYLTVNDGSEAARHRVIHDLEHDPAFNPGKELNKEHTSLGAIVNKTATTFQTVGRCIVHPKDTVKSKLTKTTARQLSKTGRPYLSQKSDFEFLQAYDNLNGAESTSSSMQDNMEGEYDTIVNVRRDRLREMEAHRESLQVAWTTSRHVRRVRAVPKHHVLLPKAEQFAERNARGKLVRYNWLEWLGYNIIYYTQGFSTQYIDNFDKLPFNIDSCRCYTERLVMASAPWQAWVMRVRSVYRWERPMVTGKWLALYLILWYTQHIMGFIYVYVIFIVLRNRYRPTSIESLRESMERSLENSGTACKFGELIDKHGRHDWLELVISDIGPYTQLQLGDVANMLEILSNFYHWRNPQKTFATLFFFASCLTVSLFADMAYCMKIVWFVVGGTFFFCWPIASIYPKYRYLVSPFKWVLWDIPTNAEWSFQYLRRQAQKIREELVMQRVEEGHLRELANPAVDRYMGQTKTMPKIHVNGGLPDDSHDHSSDDDNDDDDWQSATSTTSVLEASDLRSFRASSGSSIGRLVVYSKGVRFIKSPSKFQEWTVPFLEMAEMSKAQGGRLSKLVSSPNQLQIKTVDGIDFCLENMKARDEAFNTIIAFSGLQWQSLQITHDTKIPET